MWQPTSLSTSRHCRVTGTILAGDRIYIWEDHVGAIVDSGLEEKVNIAQKAIALIWCKMKRIRTKKVQLKGRERI